MPCVQALGAAPAGCAGGAVRLRAAPAARATLAPHTPCLPRRVARGSIPHSIVHTPLEGPELFSTRCAAARRQEGDDLLQGEPASTSTAESGVLRSAARLLGGLGLLATASLTALAGRADAAAVPETGAQAAECSTQRGARDTGIMLAEASTSEAEAPKAQLFPKPGSPTWKRLMAPEKAGKKVKDPLKSMTLDPDSIPEEDSADMKMIQSKWRLDKLKNMTYTQFWILVREGHIDEAKFTMDRRSIVVTTKDSAPGGARQERVGLPYDPELFDHMVEHGVYVEVPSASPLTTIVLSLMRIFFPFVFATILVKVAFRLGRKAKPDRLFGGARLQMIKKGDIAISFSDIAGIDQVKAEIVEIVQFLQNPKRFLELGARTPAGVLLVGPPGTGKTLLAKAIAGEAGVPFFSAAGTEFMEMYVGVGASRIRDMFERARKNAPCILFIDEFDGLGKQRGSGGMGDDESVHTINQLLTEMDGFEDNTGVVVMAATNRPAALDTALIRPGRFDRIIHLPLPNLEGRIGILKVHARDKSVAPSLDFRVVARATAGFTGAELMNLMNQSAIMCVRAGRELITQEDVFDALEKIHMEKFGSGQALAQYDEDIVPPLLRRQIAVYEAAKACIAYASPSFDEISKVSVCPGGMPTGYTYFIPQESHLEAQVVTRGFMMSKIVVAMAGRVGEKLVLGDANISTAGAFDLEHANNLAREMVYRCGFSSKLGPVALMDDEEDYLNPNATHATAALSTDLARAALEEIEGWLDGAEAKAAYGLAINWRAFAALVEALLEKETLSGRQVAAIFDAYDFVRFEDTYVEGFGWERDGSILFPNDDLRAVYAERAPPAMDVTEPAKPEGDLLKMDVHPLNPYVGTGRYDVPELLSDSLLQQLHDYRTARSEGRDAAALSGSGASSNGAASNNSN